MGSLSGAGEALGVDVAESAKGVVRELSDASAGKRRLHPQRARGQRHGRRDVVLGVSGLIQPCRKERQPIGALKEPVILTMFS